MRQLRPWEIDPNWTCPPCIASKESWLQKMRRSWEETAYIRRNWGMGITAILIWPFIYPLDILFGDSNEDAAEKAARAEERGLPPKA